MRRAVPTLLALAGVLFASAPPAGASADGDPADRVAVRVGEVLAVDCGRTSNCGAVKSSRLAAIGRSALPILFDVLVGGRFEIEDGDATQAVELDHFTRGVVLATIRARSAAEVHELLAERIGPDAGRRERLAALDVLAFRGKPRDLEPMILVATVGWEEPLLERGLARELRRRIASVLERNPGGFRALESVFLRAPVAAREAMILAVGQVGSAEGYYVLGIALGLDRHLDGIVLSQIARVAVTSQTGSDDVLRARVRDALGDASTEVAGEAAVAAARLDDFDAVPLLIEHLEHDDPELRSKAHWALVRISGLGLRPEADRWRRWHAREVEWWNDRSQRVFDQLSSDEPAYINQAVRSIARQRMYRNELAAQLARALAHDDPRILVRACGALRELRSTAALPALIDCLAFPDDEVQAAAWATLKAITGRSLPPEPETWRRAYPG